MNFREGMRRVGLVLGLAGGITGSILGYSQIVNTRQSRSVARRFQQLKTGRTLVKFLKTPAPLGPSKFMAIPTGEDFDVPENGEGIKSVTLDNGIVKSIRLTSGKAIYDVEATAATDYFTALLMPIVGFMVPWGSCWLLWWVGSGFVSE